MSESTTIFSNYKIASDEARRIAIESGQTVRVLRTPDGWMLSTVRMPKPKYPIGNEKFWEEDDNCSGDKDPF